MRYSCRPNIFDTYAQDIAVLLATHASVALRSALDDADLRLAIDSCHLIGQAQGILTERYSLDAGRASACSRESPRSATPA